MDLGLRGKVAFVTGASAGLGYGVAVELARAGSKLAICSRNSERVNKAAQAISTEAEVDPDCVLSVVCDVTDEARIEESIRQVADKLGGIDVLVTNAGGPPAGFIDDFSSDDWRNALELNFMSTVNLCRHALPHLRKAGRERGLARIIIISSISAKQPIPNLYLSNAARAGVQGFAKNLAEEVGVDGVTVNTVLPGYTRTARLDKLVDAVRQQTGQSRLDIENSWAQANALKRIGEVNEFASLVAFLASARASYITGAAIPVDGGRSKHLL